MLAKYRDQTPFETKDRSLVRELMHPAVHGNRQQSLAEARLAPGLTTRLHRHHRSEELYHVTAGRALMTLGDAQFPIEVGDTIAIPPGTPHCLVNSGDQELVILCCCSPAYRHDDTQLL